MMSSGPDVGPAVGDVLGMDERDALDRLVEREEDGTGQSIEVAAGDETHKAPGSRLQVPWKGSRFRSRPACPPLVYLPL